VVTDEQRVDEKRVLDLCEQLLSRNDPKTTRPEVFLGEQRGSPEAFAHAMINAGASLVFASGPHILRGLEWFHGHVAEKERSFEGCLDPDGGVLTPDAAVATD